MVRPTWPPPLAGVDPVKGRVLSGPQRGSREEAGGTQRTQSPAEMALPAKQPCPASGQGPEADGAPGDHPLGLTEYVSLREGV